MKPHLRIDVDNIFVIEWLEQIATRNQITAEEVGNRMLAAGLESLIQLSGHRIERAKQMKRMQRSRASANRRYRERLDNE